VREGALRARVPLAVDPCRIGRDPASDLVVDDPRVARAHARVRYVKGEYVLSGEGDAPVYVNGKRAPLLALRTGDLVSLTRPDDMRPVCLRFESRIEGSFLAPGTPLGEAWLSHPASRDASQGPDRFGPGEPLGGRPLERVRRGVDPESGTPVVVKVLGRVHEPVESDRHLRLLAAIAGSPHPDLAFLLDGGVAVLPDGPVRWMATRWEDGESVKDLLEAGPLPLRDAVRVLRALASAVAHLHRRGVVHRDVAPGNVVVLASAAPTQPRVAALIDYGQAFLAEGGAPEGRGVVGTPGYVAPEEVARGGAAVGPAADVYGTAAVGYAMLTGAPPVGGGDVLDVLARAGRPPTAPRELGVAVPEALEGALLAALHHDPARRPDAASFVRALAFADALLAVGGAA
jgi:hypothetical protein